MRCYEYCISSHLFISRVTGAVLEPMRRECVCFCVSGELITRVCVFFRFCPDRRAVCSHTPSFIRTIPAGRRSWSRSLMEESCSSPSCSTPSVPLYILYTSAYAVLMILLSVGLGDIAINIGSYFQPLMIFCKHVNI